MAGRCHAVKRSEPGSKFGAKQSPRWLLARQHFVGRMRAWQRSCCLRRMAAVAKGRTDRPRETSARNMSFLTCGSIGFGFARVIGQVLRSPCRRGGLLCRSHSSSRRARIWGSAGTSAQSPGVHVSIGVTWDSFPGGGRGGGDGQTYTSHELEHSVLRVLK